MTDCGCTHFASSLGNVTFDQGVYVGIGTSAPSWQLHVKDNNPNTLVLVDTTTAAQSSQLVLGEAGALVWQLYKPGGSHDLRFYNQGVDRVTLQDGTGRVGIGTNAPAYPLDVNGTIHCTGILLGGNMNLYGTIYDSSGTYARVDANGCFYAS